MQPDSIAISAGLAPSLPLMLHGGVVLTQVGPGLQVSLSSFIAPPTAHE